MNDFCLLPEIKQLPSGRLFLLFSNPESDNEKGPLVLVLPPFAEEMNKARKMIVTTQNALSKAHLPSLLLDLYGTGDSEGDFAAASWQRWQENVHDALNILSDGFVDRPIHVIAIRTGALLVNNLLSGTGSAWRDRIDKIHYWQPVFQGKSFLKQLLRIRLAKAMYQGDDKKENMPSMLEELRTKGCIEVAGYHISSALFDAIESSNPQLPVMKKEFSACFYEINQSEDISIGLKNAIPSVMGENNVYSSVSVLGERFWSTQEITINPELLAHTLANITVTEEI